MKKVSKILCICLLLFAVLLTNAGFVAQADTVSVSRTISSPYEYPVLPGTEEWVQLDGNVEMIESCQIPEDIMQNMTTEALVETVLNYPRLMNLFAFNSMSQGFQAMLEDCNGLAELVTRSDAPDLLMDAYENMHVWTEEEYEDCLLYTSRCV